MNEDGRPDAETPDEPVHDALAVALNDAPLVRKAIHRWVAAWRTTHPDGDDVERLRTLELVWQLVEDQRDRDERTDPTDPTDPQSRWAGIME